MTELTDLSTDDQIILMRTPNSLVLAAAYVEQDGFLSLSTELKAGLQAAIDAASAFPTNQIIQRLALEMNVVDHEEAEAAEELAATSDDPHDLIEARNPTRSRGEALDLAAESMAIMEANATIEETIEFKYWLYSLADQVTIASKAGGFLGIGGVQVSELERVFLHDLRAALGMETKADDVVDTAVEARTAADVESGSVEPGHEVEAERAEDV